MEKHKYSFLEIAQSYQDTFNALTTQVLKKTNPAFVERLNGFFRHDWSFIWSIR